MAGAWLKIIDTKTERETLYWDKHFDTSGTSGVYQWTDGNYGCDCNRDAFFEQASGVTNEEEVECNSGPGRFYVPFAYTADGRILKIDEERV